MTFLANLAQRWREWKTRHMSRLEVMKDVFPPAVKPAKGKG